MRTTRPAKPARVVQPAGRHPGDVVRAVLATTGLTLASWIAARGHVSSLEENVFRLVNRLPALVDDPLRLVMQAGALAAVPVVAVVALCTRRVRLAIEIGVGGVAAWLLAKALKSLVGRHRPYQALNDVFRHSTDGGLGFPSGHAAVAAALATVLGPFVGRRTRRALWGVAIVVGIARVYVGAHLPLDVFGGWMLGWLVGSVIHLAVGAPLSMPTRASTESALGTLLGGPATIKPLNADARGSTPYLVSSGGRTVFAKILTNENRDADALFKLTRLVLYRRLEDERPFTSPQQIVEHEAYSGLMAARAGVATPRLVGTARFEDSAVLVTELIPDSKGFDSLDDARFSALLDDLWRQVKVLHAARIAHRDLRPANVMVAGDGTVELIDFGFSQVSATDRLLAVDVAELLAASALRVGVERATQSAVGVMGHDELVGALPFLQPLALNGETRTEMHKHRSLLGELRTHLAERLGVAQPKLEPLARVRTKNVLSVLVLALAVHFLLGSVGELSEMTAAIRHARWGWFVAALCCSALSYLAAGVVLRNASPNPIPLRDAVTAQLASSFGNRFIPYGGIGVIVRFLQRRGLTTTEATTTVATADLGGFAIHMPLLLLTGVVTGLGGLKDVHLPKWWEVMVGVVVVAALVGIVALTPLKRRVLKVVETALRQTRTVLADPARARGLLVGSFGVTSSYIMALVCALHAVGDHTRLTYVAFAYLAGSALASAAPTPGGLGAVEAALVAGLTALGVVASTALAGVLLFRLATFWLPTLPSWATFAVMRKRGEL